MKNNFDELDSDTRLPNFIKTKLKRETMGNLNAMRTLLDIMDLFFVKAGATLSQSFSSQTSQEDQDQGGKTEY